MRQAIKGVSTVRISGLHCAKKQLAAQRSIDTNKSLRPVSVIPLSRLDSSIYILQITPGKCKYKEENERPGMKQ
jgi:hypothetical protein